VSTAFGLPRYGVWAPPLLAETDTIKLITQKSFLKITPAGPESMGIISHGRQFHRRTGAKADFPNPLHGPHLCSFQGGEFSTQVNSQAMPVFNDEPAIHIDIAHRPIGGDV